MDASPGRGATHQVSNQPPPLQGYDAFATDHVLVEAVQREGADWASGFVSEVGRFAGSERAIELGFRANESPPRLVTHDRFGNRIDRVDYHPAYHELMDASISAGLHSLPWVEPRPGAHVARGAAFFCFSQAEAGVGCPTSMTYSVIPALRAQPELAAEWEPRLLATEYDPADVAASEKRGCLAGMGMTEKQGGSDVRANTTVAEPANGGGPGSEYLLTGHKWFMSAPMCDAFLVLAQAPTGISCFLFPRRLSDGSLNSCELQRLKDKLGNRSNASSEVEFERASAHLIGEEGDGVRTIIGMVNHTRLDCVLGAAAGIRLGTVQAIHHASNRSAFGKRLVDQPLMRNVLCDLAIESEAATIAAMRLARSYDEAADGAEAAVNFRRLANGTLKYWLCKRAPVHAAEALECLGGNGYVEESVMPRLYRESPLNSIWEGSGDVQCLDVLRAMAKSPDATDAFLDELDAARGEDSRLDSHVADLRARLSDPEAIESRARRTVEAMALALQGSLLVRFGDPAVADAFCASRLGGEWGRALGTLPPGFDAERILARHAVAA